MGNEDVVDSMMTKFTTRWHGKILELVAKKDPKNELLLKAQEIIAAQPDRKSGE